MAHKQLTTYQAVISQARAFRALKSFLGLTLDVYSLTMTEWLIIGLAIDEGPSGIRVSTLAKRLGVEMPVITNLVRKAADDGWLRRIEDPKDKRAKRFVITHVGMNKACDIEGELRAATAGWLDDLDPAMLKGYYTVVGALSDKELPNKN